MQPNAFDSVQALILDGAVDSVGTAPRLADELLKAHAPHLPQFRIS
jgi:alpha-galactosidase/6-phospho-beta-glucosidase family protein